MFFHTTIKFTFDVVGKAEKLTNFSTIQWKIFPIVWGWGIGPGFLRSTEKLLHRFGFQQRTNMPLKIREEQYTSKHTIIKQKIQRHLHNNLQSSYLLGLSTTKGLQGHIHYLKSYLLCSEGFFFIEQYKVYSFKICKT